jgi:hypothetical protein
MRGGKWKARFSFLTGNERRGDRGARATPFRPGLEALEDRRVPANPGSISGHVLIDPTGNGAAPDNAPQSHVTVKLFQDTNGNGVLDSTDSLVAWQATGADGSYSFNNLAAGTYFVTESVPGG